MMTDPDKYAMQSMSKEDFDVQVVDKGRQLTPSIKRYYMKDDKQLEDFLNQFREIKGNKSQDTFRNHTRILVWARDSESNMLIKIGGGNYGNHGITAGYLHDIINKEGTKWLEDKNPAGEATFDRYMLDIWHTEIDKGKGRRYK